MKDLRDRIVAWRRRRYGAEEDRYPLPPGVSPEAIAQAEGALGVTLPAEVREFYALHDPVWLPINDDRLSLQEMVDTWNYYCGDWSTTPRAEWRAKGSNPEGPIKPDWWNRRWIPITYNQGNCHFLDLDPAPGGNVGQVCDYDIEGPRTRVVAPKFRAWVERLVTDLEQTELQQIKPAEQPRVRMLDQYGRPFAEPDSTADGGRDPGSS